MKIAIIGAGISGLSLAHALNKHFLVTVFEKARGVSGRLATRYQDDFAFDHGAAHFTVRENRFLKFLEPLQAQGIITKWQPIMAEFEHNKQLSEQICREPLFVNSPKMNQLCKYLSEPVNVKTQTRVAKLIKQQGQWLLEDEQGNHLGHYDWVISSAPCEQTKALFGTLTNFQEKLSQTRMSGCFSLMLGLSELPLPAWQLAKINNSRLAKISIEHSKPNRNQGISILVQSDNHWADQHIEQELETIIQLMKAELKKILPFDEAAIEYQRLHRWRYANVAKSAEESFLIDSESRLAACGDWCIEGRVESAFISAIELAERLNAQ